MTVSIVAGSGDHSWAGSKASVRDMERHSGPQGAKVHPNGPYSSAWEGSPLPQVLIPFLTPAQLPLEALSKLVREMSWKVIWVFKIRIYYTIVFARKDQDLSYKPISSPLPGYSLYTRGAVVTFGNTLFLWASLQVKKHLQVSSKISLFYKHLPKQIIIACVHISCIQTSKQPRASSLQNLKFFTGLGRCQQWQGQQAPLITKGKKERTQLSLFCCAQHQPQL